MLKLKRAYEPVSKDDGYRILIDRLWPRGIKKQKPARRARRSTVNLVYSASDSEHSNAEVLMEILKRKKA